MFLIEDSVTKLYEDVSNFFWLTFNILILSAIHLSCREEKKKQKKTQTKLF